MSMNYSSKASLLRVLSNSAAIVAGFLIAYFGFNSNAVQSLPNKDAITGNNKREVPAPPSFASINSVAQNTEPSLFREEDAKTAVESITNQLAIADPVTSSREIWLPLSAVPAFHWHFGDIGTNFRLSRETQVAMAISDPQKKAINQAIDQFLDLIRNTEIKSLEVLENKGESILLHIPANIPFKDPLESVRGTVRSILGEEKAQIFLPRLENEISTITPLLKGEQRFINVKLVGEAGVEIAVSSRPDDISSWSNYIPSTMKHLVKVGEDNLKK